jgi:ABC-type branched-subunit amino acid transport system substrate-binding protein
MMRQLRVPVLLTILLVLLASLAAIPGQAEPAPRQQAPTILNMGWMEGRGAPGERGARLAARQINAAGGVTGPDGTTYQFQIAYPQRPLVVAEDMRIVLRNLLDQQVVSIIGPARDELILPNLDPLSSASVPILTLAAADTITDIDANDNILRMRAAERFHSRALANVLLQDIGATRFALIQTDVASTEALVLFEQVLQAADIEPVIKLQRVDNATLADDAAEIVAAAPEVVVLWGAPDDATTLLQTLRSANYQGEFAYRDALQAVNAGVMSPRLAEGTIGVGGWVYTTPNEVSRIFLVDFVTEYNRIPDGTEAAAYDAVWILRRYIENGGVNVDQLYNTLVQSPPIFTVQGRLEPGTYGNGDVSRHVTVYRMRDTGGPQIVARFANDVRLAPDQEVDDDPNIVGLIGTITATPTPSSTPTITFTPSLTPIPTDTPLPTATPDVVTVIGTLDAVNLRAGPDTTFDILGQLLEGERVPAVGANVDRSWLVVTWRGQQVWVSADVVDVFDPGGLVQQLPVADAQTARTPGALIPPAERAAGPDLVIDSVLLNPPSLIPNQGFTATVLIRNQGGQPAGPFSIGTTFQPGNITVAGNSAGVAANSATGVDLSGVARGSGQFSVNVTVDTNNTVAETNENNNVYTFTYNVSSPVIAQVEGLTINVNTSRVLTGATPDILWDGFNLLAQGNARLGNIPGLSYDTSTADTLNPALLTLPSIDGGQIFPGATFGIITNEGQRGIIRIDGNISGTAVISYRIFGN